jgi:Rha family phage regulatory protein
MTDIVKLTTQDITSAIPITTSLIIAEYFEKRHDNVLRDIEEIIDQVGRLNFEESSFYVKRLEYVNTQNKSQPYYELNEDFWMLLVMGYTGEKAFKIKTTFIKTFQLMKRELLVRETTRHIGKVCRLSLTDSVKKNVNGEGNFKRFAYSNYTKLVYKKVLGMDVKKSKENRGLLEKDNLRNFLTIAELEKVQDLESKIAGFIEVSNTEGKDDKQIYSMVKEWLDKKC